MELKHIDRPFEVKKLDESGVFEGYVSVFNNVDKGGDIVLPGAFKDTIADWAAKGEFPPVLWQHRTGEPLGPTLEMREDNVGLWIKGQLLIEHVPRAKEAWALLKAKAIKGMSIGYVPRDESVDRAAGTRGLKKVDLWENSIVTFPMNPMAGVSSVKAAIDALESLAAVEGHLQDVGGFSKAQAAALVHRIKSLTGRSESGLPEEVIASLHSLQKSLQGRSESDELGDLLPGLKGLMASLN